MQLYTPNEIMVNKDFIRELLTEEKKLMPMKDLKQVNAPNYDEISV